MVGVPRADTRSSGHSFQVIAQSGVDKISPGPKLDALMVERVLAGRISKHKASLVK
jgi:hypothetical protein